MKLAVVAIGGPHGSGKSSIAKKIANEFNMTYLSAGEVFRKLAKEKNYTIEEFTNYALTDSEIDKEIDNRTAELSKQSNTVVDAQLAAYFTPKNSVLKICITASPEIRYERISKRQQISLEEAKNETIIREEVENQRFKELYKINVNDLNVYDAVINTDRLSIQQTFNYTKAIVKEALNLITER